MIQVIKDFKSIMTDKHERMEFIGSFLSVAAVIVMMFFFALTLSK